MNWKKQYKIAQKSKEQRITCDTNGVTRFEQNELTKKEIQYALNNRRTEALKRTTEPMK